MSGGAKAPAGGGRRGGADAGVQFRTSDGVQVMLDENHELPLVDVQVALRTGSVHDPEGREGLTRLMGRMVRMGTSKIDGNAVEERIAELGGRLSVETSPSFVRFHGVVIKRNLEPFVELLAHLLRKPAFRAADLAHVKRETISDIVAGRDNDRGLAARNFRRFFFRGHPYGRPLVGWRSSVKAIKRSEIAEHYKQRFVAQNLVLGAAGDVSRPELEDLLERHLSGLPRGPAPKVKVPAPKAPRGRRVLIVDKPERTQTQLFVGTLGSKVGDDDYFPLMVANAAFGGTFTSRLMNEVRSKRGWSYGAYSRVGQDRQRDAWYMWTFPAAKDLADCLRLELELLEGFAEGQLSGRELSFAKQYLANSHCFEVDTAPKRLDARMDCELYGLPQEYWERFTRYVRGVKLADAKAAVKRRLSSRNLAIAVVATASDVRDAIEQLPGVASVEVIPYDRD